MRASRGRRNCVVRVRNRTRRMRRRGSVESRKQRDGTRHRAADRSMRARLPRRQNTRSRGPSACVV